MKTKLAVCSKCGDGICKCRRSPGTARLLLLALLLTAMAPGCAVVTANRSFPKVTWYWTKDAQMQRDENAAEKQYQTTPKKP